MDYDQENDFVIDLDGIYEYLGFARKDHAKRLLVRNFDEKKDYMLQLPSQGELVKSRIYHEKIMVSPNTFKEMCIKANTEKAHQIRKYYLKMESIFQRHVMEELKHANMTIQDLQNELQKYKTRQRKRYEFGDTVYIAIEKVCDKGHTFTICKVGSTENMNNREEAYFCHTNTTKIIYTKRCKDRKILEDALHHRFAPYQYNGRKDWFVVEFNTVKEALDKLQLALDGEVSTSTFDETSLKNISEYHLDQPHSNPIEQVDTDTDDDEQVEDIKQEHLSIEKKPLEKPVFAAPDPEYNVVLEQCFEQSIDSLTAWIDIAARYKLWKRDTSHRNENLMTYLKDQGFKETLMYDEETKINATAFQGLKMIAYNPICKPTSKSSDVEKFAYEVCVSNVTGRISTKDLSERYVQWKQRIDPDYSKIHKNDKKSLNEYFKSHFLQSTVHTGERIRFGFYGVSIKGEEMKGRKSKKGNRKQVLQLNPNTLEVVQEFESITHASKEIGVTISALSIAISAQRICKGFRFSSKILDGLN
jgi:phage anti-repressor protein